MDLSQATFIGLMTIGFVNVFTWVFPSVTDPRVKFTAAVAVAFGLSFVPADLGNVLLTHIKLALEVAAMSSGAYKLSQNMKSS